MIFDLRRNFGYKLISLGLAILLYVIAYAQKNPRTAQDIFVQPQVTSLPRSLIVSEGPKGFTILVSGPSPAVEALRIRGAKGIVDGSRARPGTVKLPLELDIPPDLKSQIDISNQPIFVQVGVQQKTRKRFNVVPAYPNQPPPGYAYKEPLVDPRQVVVSGLEADVERVEFVVANVDAGPPNGAIDYEVTVVPQDHNQQVVENVEMQPQKARVRIGLKPTAATKTLLLSPVFIHEVAPGWRVVNYHFSPTRITVAGSLEQLAALTSLDVHVDLAGLTADTRRTLTVLPPVGLRVIGSADVQVMLQVRPEEPNRASAPTGGVAPNPPN